MPTTQSSLTQPPFGADKQIKATSPIGKWLVQVQTASVIREANTSGGSYIEAVSPASSNQGQEIMYVKTTADANTFTLTGVVGGNIVLTAQSPNAGSSVTVKSDGTNWYVKCKV